MNQVEWTASGLRRSSYERTHFITQPKAFLGTEIQGSAMQIADIRMFERIIRIALFFWSTRTAMCKIFQGSLFCTRTPGRWATGCVSLRFLSEIHLFAFSLADTSGCEEGSLAGDLAFDNSALESVYCQQQRTLLAKTPKYKKCLQLPLESREGTNPIRTKETSPWSQYVTNLYFPANLNGTCERIRCSTTDNRLP